MKKITIYTQAYNSEKYIRQCIESVLSQSYKNFDYIIVDNGSQDNTSRIIKEYEKKDNRIIGIFKDKNEKGFWQNIIKDKVKTKYFMRLDDDDYLDKEALIELLGFAEDNDLDLALCGSRFEKEDGTIGVLRNPIQKEVLGIDQVLQQYCRLHQFFRTIWGKLISTKSFNKSYLTFYEETVKLGGYGSDTAFIFDILLNLSKIGFCNKTLHNYRIRNKSVSYALNSKRNLSNQLLYKQAIQLLQDRKQLTNEKEEFISNVYIYSIIDEFQVIKESKTSIVEKIEMLTNDIINDISKESYKKVRYLNEPVIDFYNKVISMYFITNSKGLVCNEKIMNNVYKSLIIINPNLGNWINKDNFIKFVKHQDFLINMIGQDNVNIAEVTINYLKDKNIGKFLWGALKENNKQNSILFNINDFSFIQKNSELILKLYKKEYSEALNYCLDLLNTYEFSDIELLKITLNLSAYLEQADIFVYTKKLLAQNYIGNKIWEKAKCELKDLIDMLTVEDTDVAYLIELYGQDIGNFDMRIFLLYGHGGSYNHGAEAIIRATMDMLKKSDKGCRILLSTHFKEQDQEFQLPVDRYLERNPIALEKEVQSGNKGAYNGEVYKDTLDAIDKDTICLSVGGDNYCYPNWTKWKDIHNRALEVGAKSILWSCSIEPDMIDEDMLNTLRTHHLITARESITYNALLDKGLENVKLVADVAFLLEVEQVILPSNFIKENTVAINVSPLTARKETSKDILKQNILSLIEFILNNTDMAVTLIPHVTMPMDNDFTYLQEIYNTVEDKSRISLIEANYNVKQFKYIISQCRFGIFARTHASIAAYSSCIPTIVIGYSVKALGIAKDLDMEKYVVPINDITERNTLVEMFKTVCNEESEIKIKLNKLNQTIKQRAKGNLISLKDILSGREKQDE